jgi:hypothetical protein
MTKFTRIKAWEPPLRALGPLARLHNRSTTLQTGGARGTGGRRQVAGLFIRMTAEAAAVAQTELPQLRVNPNRALWLRMGGAGEDFMMRLGAWVPPGRRAALRRWRRPPTRSLNGRAGGAGLVHANVRQLPWRVVVVHQRQRQRLAGPRTPVVRGASPGGLWEGALGGDPSRPRAIWLGLWALKWS